jgi:hypothetical protein
MGLATASTGIFMMLTRHPGVVTDAGTLPARYPTSKRSHADGFSIPVAISVRGYLRAPVDPMDADGNGTLQVPEPASHVGWWVLGASPGAPTGTVLLTGHVDSWTSGLGVFAQLSRIPLGSVVDIEDSNGRDHSYVIRARRTYEKQKLPRDLFTDSGVPRLVLVTCTGPYDRTRQTYTRNLVLYAEPQTGSGSMAMTY